MEIQGIQNDQTHIKDSQRKIYVLDTNVLLFDSNAILGFGVHDIVIPIVVIEELDRFKKDLNDLGRNARSFSRLVDSLRIEGSLLFAHAEDPHLRGVGDVFQFRNTSIDKMDRHS